MTAALLIVAIAACSSTPPSPSPAPNTSGYPSATTPAPGETSAPGTPEPSPTDSELFSPEPGTSFEPLPPPPLPEPTLSEGGAIGQALYDEAFIPDGVVSLLEAAGVEITSTDGTVLRPGAGAMSMTEDEVRGLIDMTYDDFYAAGEDGIGPVTVADLYHGLASSLPADLTVEEFAANFNDAYANQPESLAAGVMLGIPIEPDARLLRVQQWLLLVDGFVRPDAAATLSSHALAAVGGEWQRRSSQVFQAGLGTAASTQPALVSPIAGIDSRQWADILAALPTLGFRVPFMVEGLAAVHEGHGRQGPRLDLRARIRRPADLIDARTGQVLLPADEPGDGVPMQWTSEDESVLIDHGQVVGQLNWPMLTDSSGAVQIAYQVKKETARQRTLEMEEEGTLYATVELRGLVVEAYALPSEVYGAMTNGNLVTGTRTTANYAFPIKWHEDDVLNVYIGNHYNYKYTVGGIAELHRVGRDQALGDLAYNEVDRTYRGKLSATALAHADGMAVLGAGGLAECHDDIFAYQTLYVVGEKRGNDFLLLRFYPETPPDGDATLCQPTLPFRGGGRYRRAAGAYIPLNDTRWSTPSAGYEIQIPSGHSTLDYHDDAASVPELNVCSDYWVSVTRVDPDASPAPSPMPQPPTWECPAN